jgi:hypothetical protein
MQRRAAAVSVAVFVLLAAGSFTLMGAAQQPDLALENPEYSITVEDEETIEGTTYHFTAVDAESATAEWTNQSAQYTEEWSSGDTVVYEGDDYTVAVPNQSDPSYFELREVQTVDKPTVEQNGTTYVVVKEDGDKTLVPRDEYLPTQTVYRFQEGDQIDRPNNDNATSVASVSDSAVTIQWFAPKTFEVSFSEGENTTVGGTNYLAHIETSGGQNALELTTDYEDYHSDVDQRNYFHERMNGLWGVIIISGIAISLLVMLAFLPSRY